MPFTDGVGVGVCVGEGVMRSMVHAGGLAGVLEGDRVGVLW